MRLLVHIAFHYVPDRLHFLETVIDALFRYRSMQVKIVVDTNSSELRECLKQLNEHSGNSHSLEVVVHDSLSHPYALTWAHRNGMAACIDDFDYFMYLEDDILVLPEVFDAWRLDLDLLDEFRLERGVLRVEKSNGGELFSSDWWRTAKSPTSYTVRERTFVVPDSAYQACWLLNREQMRRFHSSEAWHHGWISESWAATMSPYLATDKYMRERASFGPAFVWPGPARRVLPLGSDGQIDSICYVYHLPNNYVHNPQTLLGKVRVGRLISGVPIDARTVKARCRFMIAAAEVWIAKRTGPNPIRRMRRRLRAAVRQVLASIGLLSMVQRVRKS